jgi:hypothetical protein
MLQSVVRNTGAAVPLIFYVMCIVTKSFCMVLLVGIAYGNRLLNSGMGITSCSLQTIQENGKVSFDRVQVLTVEPLIMDTLINEHLQ